MQKKAVLYDKGGRQALRLHLGLDQVHARLGRRRLALLPGGDARGRRGPALHRAPDDRAGLRGHRQRRSAGAAWSPWRRPGRGARRHAGVRAEPQPGGRLPGAGAEVQRQHARRSRVPAPTCARGRRRSALLPPGRALLRGQEAGPRRGLRVSAQRCPAACRTSRCCPRAWRTAATTSRPTAGSRSSCGSGSPLCAKSSAKTSE